MAYLKPEIQCFQAGADLSTHQYKLVKFGSDAKTVVLCGADEEPMGVLMNAPKSGEDAEVSVGGGALVKVGGVVALNASIGSAASGVGKAAAATKLAIGKAMEAGTADGDVIAIVIDRHYAPA